MKTLATRTRGKLFSDQAQANWEAKLSAADHYFMAILRVKECPEDYSPGTNIAETFHGRLNADPELQGLKNFNTAEIRVELGLRRFNYSILNATFDNRPGKRRRIDDVDAAMGLACAHIERLATQNDVKERFFDLFWNQG